MQEYLENPNFVYALYTVIAVGVFLLITGLSQLLGRRESRGEALNRRLKMVQSGATTEEILLLLKPNQAQFGSKRLAIVGRLSKMLAQAGMTLRVGQFMVICLLCMIVLSIVALRFLDPFLAIIVGVIAGAALPVLFVSNKKNKRMTDLTTQLPDALELMARGLTVGHPLNTSIGAVAQEMADPIGTEFGIIFDQINYGDDLTDAVAEFAERVDLEDVYYLSASIGIQNGTGGDLARVIKVLGRVVRDRITMRRKIMAISSEGRLSAMFLSALPVFIYGFTTISSPNYYQGVANDPLYVPMAAVIVFFVVANFLAMRKLTNFRI